MERRDFFKYSTSAIIASTAVPLIGCTSKTSATKKSAENKPLVAKLGEGSPVAFTMWDFSWIERRWPGAGYEDWDLVLDELVERGYNGVRIDAFPHFIANEPMEERTLIPVWSQEDWGSPALNKITILPALSEFIGKCKERNIKVGLSSWFREDTKNLRMKIKSPEVMAQYWVETVKVIEKEGLLDAIMFVDICNEFPGEFWAPYFENDPPELTWGGWYTEKAVAWMKNAVTEFKKYYPEMPTTFSFDANEDMLRKRDVSFIDFLEPHIWMSTLNEQEFCKEIGYEYPLFSNEGYEALVESAEETYIAKKEYWQKQLIDKIMSIAEVSRELQTPLMTSECWALVNYKDYPLLSWDWVKELCALGVKKATETKRWTAIATSNFCGPQFVGMWRDVEWHKKMTEIIKSSTPDKGLL